MKMTSIIVFVVFVGLCCINNLLKGNMQYTWQEAMNHYIYESDIMKDISRVIDYLKVGLLQYVTSYFCCGGGGENRNRTIKSAGGTEIEKNHFCSIPL